MTTAADERLSRIRWAVRAVLALGVTASVCANVLHARPNIISQLIAAWPPLALQLTVELISRVPADRRALAVMRLVAAAVIAGIAAWVSYWHMAGVAARYGETTSDSHLLPLSVDGLVVVASISLVEIAGRLSHRPSPQSDAATPAQKTNRTRRELEVAAPADQPPAPTRAAETSQVRQTCGTASAGTPARPDDAQLAGPVPQLILPPRPIDDDAANRIEESDRPLDSSPDGHTRIDDHKHRDGARAMGRRGGTAAAVAYWYSHDPHMHPAEVASRIHRSERTVRRYWPPNRPSTQSDDT